MAKHPKLTPVLLKTSLENLPFRKIIYASLILISLNLLGVLLVQKNLPPQVPLFYGLPEGQDQLASPLGLAIPAILSLAITILNLFIALLSKNKFLQQTLILTSLVISILSFITSFKIVLLVGRFL